MDLQSVMEKGIVVEWYEDRKNDTLDIVVSGRENETLLKRD
jgi:hypothetical protein